MKRQIRILCLVLAAVLLFAVPVQAEEIAPRSSAYFTSYNTYIYKTSSTEFQIWFDVLATNTMDQIGVSWIKIQRSSDGVNWETIDTEYPEDHASMMNENTYFCTNYIPYTGTVGYYYKARVKFYAKRDNGIGALFDYTNVVKL